MRKLIRILVLGMFLAGCSGLPNITVPQFGATPTLPVSTETQTPSVSETPIPTQNMFSASTPTPLTYTPTVTMVGADLFTPTRVLDPTSTPGAPVGAAAQFSYFTQRSVGFTTVLISYHVLYWDEGPCMPRNVKISAFITDFVNTDKVLLFMRLRSKKNTLDMTDWGAGAEMLKADNGSFNYNIRTFNIHHFYYYPDAWLEYQLVAYDEAMTEIGRTPVFDRNITLARCGLH